MLNITDRKLNFARNSQIEIWLRLFHCPRHHQPSSLTWTQLRVMHHASRRHVFVHLGIERETQPEAETVVGLCNGFVGLDAV